MSPNALAYLVLALWPLASWALFRRLGPGRGLIWSLLGAYLLLPPPPAGFDLPLVPPLNKETIPSMAAIAACLLMARPGLRLLPRDPVARALLALYFAGPWLTVLANPDPVFWGAFGLPGLGLREAVGVTLMQAVLIAPFLLSRALLAGEDDLRDILWALLLGGLAYSLPMLLEVRLSPQINIWVYGYFQHLFGQMMRGDGFRPIVFLYHGLWAAFLAMTALLAACALLRDGGGRRSVMLAGAALWMAGVVVLCKSLGSLLFAAAVAPAILLLGARAQLRLAALMACLALAYPVLRGADLVPAEAIVGLVEERAPERAQSLGFRLDNEAVLIARAGERPLFGWGLWGRPLVHDPWTGQITSIPDGRWIVVLGAFGWTGLLAEFGLLALPVLRAWRRAAAAPSRVAAAVALMLGVNLVDLIPNATVTPLTWLMAGALLAWAEREPGALRRPAAPAPAAPALRVVLR